MAQYKVPQDVEADDKLIGPFSFRQFVYLLIAGGLIALAVGLFQIFPLLAIIPVPFVLFMLVLALPLKKDQPMETYLAALLSYYIKPRKRVWTPGQRESTILITAPKIVEETRKRDLTEEEATHRLSFLSDIVDSEGQSIKSVNNSVMRDDLAAEASAQTDMFDEYHSQVLEQAMDRTKAQTHQDAIDEMRNAIKRATDLNIENSTITSHVAVDSASAAEPVDPLASSVTVTPGPVENVEKPEENPAPTKVNSSIMELANNPDFSVATIAKEANRRRKENGEVFISLH
jgi:hypothetical protein